MSTCYWCDLELTGRHQSDCPGLMPPASHVPPMALPGVEDANDDETPARVEPHGDVIAVPPESLGLLDGLGGYLCTSCHAHCHPVCMDCFPLCHVCHRA